MRISFASWAVTALFVWLYFLVDKFVSHALSFTRLRGGSLRRPQRVV